MSIFQIANDLEVVSIAPADTHDIVPLSDDNSTRARRPPTTSSESGLNLTATIPGCINLHAFVESDVHL